MVSLGNIFCQILVGTLLPSIAAARQDHSVANSDVCSKYIEPSVIVTCFNNSRKMALNVRHVDLIKKIKVTI